MNASLNVPIFDVQRFSIHDGPGIRTTIFFKGCNLKCVWCQNPESQEVLPVISFYKNRCQESFSCADVCSEGAIIKDGFRIDYECCTRCLQCVDACPNDALKLIGKPLGPEGLFDQIIADLAYYESSGGGVTFSGGEPTLYPAFMDKILNLCNARGIHTTLETCGTFAQKRWVPILPKIQLIYFDLKIMDDIHHKLATGMGNHRILGNARYLVAKGYPVEFRLPLVPGYTDDLKNLEATTRFLKQLGQDKIHLLGYHRMGETKIDVIQAKQRKLGLENYTNEKLEEITHWFEQKGITVL